MKARCNSLEMKRLDYAEFKRNLRKRTIRSVPDDLNCWECETCGHALLSEAGYVNHVKSHAISLAHFIGASLPSWPQGHTCLLCKKSLQIRIRTKETHGCHINLI